MSTTGQHRSSAKLTKDELAKRYFRRCLTEALLWTMFGLVLAALVVAVVHYLHN